MKLIDSFRMVALHVLLLLIPCSIFAQSYPTVTGSARRYDERATDHLLANRNDSAIALYNVWLTANPRDNVSWYNLACALAKSGRSDDALRCLQNAARTGFSQSKATSEDPDLASVRSMAAFTEALRIMDSTARGDSLPGIMRRYLPSRALGTYVALLPPD